MDAAVRGELLAMAAADQAVRTGQGKGETGVSSFSPWQPTAGETGCGHGTATAGQTEAARQAYWRWWPHAPLTAKEQAAVRRSVTSGRPYGAPSWAEQTAARLGLDLAPRRRGRPPEGHRKMN